PSHTPSWMPRCPVESVGEEGRWGRAKHDVIHYLMVEKAAGLLFMANLGCIEFHPLHSRCASIGSPDYLFFDLDPFEPATFEDVLAVASHVRVVCEGLGLTAYPKISGATGMQIYVPLIPGAFTYEEVREFVGRVGHLIRQADPDRVTMEGQGPGRPGGGFDTHNKEAGRGVHSAEPSVRAGAGRALGTPGRRARHAR